MKKLLILSLLLLVIISLSCKKKVNTEIGLPNEPGLYWCLIPQGEYTYGNPAQTKFNLLAYWIMQYEVSNDMYVTFLNSMYNTFSSSGDRLIEIDTAYKRIMGYENYFWIGGILEPSGEKVLFYNMALPNYQYCYAGIDLMSGVFDIRVVTPWFAFRNDMYTAPVVNVTWYGANAFAKAYGWRLPTEYEWECAARGNTGFDYPWGNTCDSSNANYTQSKDPFSEGVTPVGYYNGQTHGGILNTYNFQTNDSPSPYLVYDMAGNVNEWCDSKWAPGNNNRVFRGGSWYGCQPGDLRVYLRNANNPQFNFSNIGFRCVSDRTPPGQMDGWWDIFK